MIETIEKEFREKVPAKISLREEGIKRYRVFTPFMFDDGDHLSVALKQDNGCASQNSLKMFFKLLE